MAEGVRQFVKYSFYRVDPAWRRLPDGEREDHRRELEAVVGEFGGRMEVRSYTLVGLRADVDFLLWQVATDLRDVQEMATGRVMGPSASTVRSVGPVTYSMAM